MIIQLSSWCQICEVDTGVAFVGNQKTQRKAGNHSSPCWTSEESVKPLFPKTCSQVNLKSFQQVKILQQYCTSSSRNFTKMSFFTFSPLQLYGISAFNSKIWSNSNHTRLTFQCHKTRTASSHDRTSKTMQPAHEEVKHASAFSHLDLIPSNLENWLQYRWIKMLHHFAPPFVNALELKKTQRNTQ